MRCHHKTRRRGKVMISRYAILPKERKIRIPGHPTLYRDSPFPSKVEFSHKVIVNRHKPVYSHYACNRGIIDQLASKIHYQIVGHIITGLSENIILIMPSYNIKSNNHRDKSTQFSYITTLEFYILEFYIRPII